MSYSSEEAPKGYCRGVWENYVRAQVPFKHKNVPFVPFSRDKLTVTRREVNENIRGPNMVLQLRAEARALKDRLYAEHLKGLEKTGHASQTAMGYHPDVGVSVYGGAFLDPPGSAYQSRQPFQSAQANKTFTAMNNIMLDDLRQKQDLAQNIRMYERQQQYIADGKNDELLQFQQPKYTSDYWAKRSTTLQIMEPPILPAAATRQSPPRSAPASSSPGWPSSGVSTYSNKFDESFGFQGGQERDRSQRATQRIGRMMISMQQ